jgi:hypothetical protein
MGSPRSHSILIEHTYGFIVGKEVTYKCFYIEEFRKKIKKKESGQTTFAKSKYIKSLYFNFP